MKRKKKMKIKSVDTNCISRIITEEANNKNGVFHKCYYATMHDEPHRGSHYDAKFNYSIWTNKTKEKKENK